MKPNKSKILDEISSYSSYILIQTIDKSVSDGFSMSLADEQEKTYNYSISTLILPTKWPLMVTVGHFLFPLLTEKELHELKTNQFITLDSDKLKKKIKFYLYHNDKVDSQNESKKENYIELKASYLMLSKDLAFGFSEIFKYRTKQSTPASENSLTIPEALNDYKYFSLLVLEENNPAIFPTKLRYSHILNIEKPQEGEKAYVISSPFAMVSPILYRNTVQVTQICKVTSRSKKGTGPKKGFIFLTSNALKEGEEGAPVFNREFQVIGLSLVGVSPYKNDSLGFAVCIGTHYLIDLLLKIPDTQISSDIWKILTSKYKPIVKSLPVKILFSRIVKVIAGASVASGVLLDQSGYILTNRHVVQDHQGKPIAIEINYHVDFEHYPAEIFEISSGNLDIALLKIQKPLSMKGKKLLKDTEKFLDHSVDVRYLQGSKVHAIGYTFNQLQSLDLKAISTQGYLSKIIVYKNSPFLIATTCQIFNGFSGGAIISENGHFLGLITYNFTHSKRGNLNDLNFSYSSHLFKDLIDLLEAKDEKQIKDLEIWNMNDGYIQKMQNSQTIEYVPCFEFTSKL